MADPELLVDVPSCADLARRGLARVARDGRGDYYVVSAEGQNLMTDAMMHNGRVLRDNPALAHERALAAVRASRDAS